MAYDIATRKHNSRDFSAGIGDDYPEKRRKAFWVFAGLGLSGAAASRLMSPQNPNRKIFGIGGLAIGVASLLGAIFSPKKD